MGRDEKVYMFSVQKAVSHELRPEVKKRTRVRHFEASFVVRKSDHGGVEFAARSIDDPRMLLPQWLMNAIAKKIIPQSIKAMISACENYDTYVANAYHGKNKFPALDGMV